jgi:hypothetical protein
MDRRLTPLADGLATYLGDPAPIAELSFDEPAKAA